MPFSSGFKTCRNHKAMSGLKCSLSRKTGLRGSSTGLSRGSASGHDAPRPPGPTLEYYVFQNFVVRAQDRPSHSGKSSSRDGEGPSHLPPQGSPPQPRTAPCPRSAQGAPWHLTPPAEVCLSLQQCVHLQGAAGWCHLCMGPGYLVMHLSPLV